MITTTSSNFRKNLSNLLIQTIKYSEPVDIVTKEGSAILIKKEDYNAIMETLYLNAIPNMSEKIIEGLNTQFEDCISSDEVDLNV